MKITPKVLLLAASLTTALSVQAQTTLTDFTTSAGFGSSTSFGGAGGAISFSSGVANFTVTGPTESDSAYVRYTGAVGSYTSDWSVQIDTKYTTASGIFTVNQSQYVNIGLLVVQTGVALGADGSGNPNFNGFEVAYNIYQNTSNTQTKDFRTSVWSVGDFQDGAQVGSGSANTLTTAIQISYNATTHTLSGGYDANGATSGYSFTAIPSLTSDASTWGLSGSDTFSIYLYANSGYDGGGGTSQIGPSIAAGQATFDNLTGTGLTAVPEPSTYAAIAGALALGLAAWRRKSRANVAA